MEKQKKRWGDRADARWIRELDGLHVIMPHLMDKRTDAEVYVNMEFDVTRRCPWQSMPVRISS